MYNIYEIRSRLTHQVLYLNLFQDGQKPDEVFRLNPDSQKLADAKLYINVREERYKTEQEAWSACMHLFVQYKLMPANKLQENIKSPKVLENVIPKAVQSEPKKRAPRKAK